MECFPKTNDFFCWVLACVKAGFFTPVWVVSAANLKPPFPSPASRSLHGRPDCSGSMKSTDLQPSPSLSPPQLAYDEAYVLYHGYACLESTSASLRPKKQRFFLSLVPGGEPEAGPEPDVYTE